MSLRRRLAPVLLLFALLVLWAAFARFSGLSELVVAGPWDVARTLVDEAGLLLPATLVTGSEALLGLLLAIVTGVALAVLLHLSPLLRDAALPLIIASQAVPLVVLAPLLVIAFGFGLAPKLLIVALACFFPIVIASFDGLRATDPQLTDLLRSLGAGRLRRLWLAELPAALPRLLSGVRIAATWAFIAAVFAEYAGSDSGLGYLIARGTPTFDTTRVYAAIVILTIGSLALYGATALIERAFVPWERRSRTHT